MWYGLASFPDLKHPGIDRFREKYDPTWPFIREHIPVMMPVPVTIDLELLTRHIRSVLAPWSPFMIHLKGLAKTWDHWLFLDVQEGRKTIELLHDEMYTGMLEPFLRRDIPYQPHLGLGLFASGDYDPFQPGRTGLDQEKYGRALEEAGDLDLDLWYFVDSFDLIELDDPVSRLIIRESFRLS